MFFEFGVGAFDSLKAVEMKTIHVILSGGVGSRLWPLSRKSRPKQYIPMFDGKSLFQLTAERNKGLVDEIIVVGNKDNYHLSQADLTAAGISNYLEIIEAEPRNTAAAIAFAAFAAQPEDLLLITPSDQIIDNQEAYTAAITQAILMAQADALVTFGIAPTKPETGYGYIEHDGNNVLSFREKPDFATAQTFLDRGTFLWNSGLFCFKAGVYLDELKRHEPLLFEKAHKAWKAQTAGFLPLAETQHIPAKSIDYAVMEKSSFIKVVPSYFGWSDLGSYEAIWDYFDGLEQSPHFHQNNLVLGTTKHVEFLGLEGLVLVETPDAILVLSKEKSQDVKALYERLGREKPGLLG